MTLALFLVASCTLAEVPQLGPQRTLMATSALTITSITASVNPGAARKATDGSLSSAWTSSYQGNATLTATLAQPYQLAALRLKVTPRQLYSVQVSSDLRSWTTVLSNVANATRYVETRALPAGTLGQYVRLVFPGSYAQVFDLHVDGQLPATPAPTAAPTTAPTTAPTVAPTAAPTAAPTVAPTANPTAVPTPAPTPLPAVDGMAVPDTAYAIPAGALFVAPAGNDAGTGTQAAPFATVQRAVDAAPAGGTVVLRGGSYREAVDFHGKRLTMQAYPHEQAWIKGSVVVTGWVQDGTAWRKDGWSYQFQTGDLGSDASVAIDPAYPLAAHPDLAFLDGKPLVLVAGRAQVGPGKFFVDYATKQLFIGDNPTGKTVEAGAFENGVTLNGANTVVRGVGFAHTPGNRQHPAVKAYASGITLENCAFSWNATSGLSVGSFTNCVVRGNTFAYNGQLGLKTWQSHGLLVEGNRITGNNERHFSRYWEAGGFKCVATNNSTWRDNRLSQNQGTAMWYDIDNDTTTVVRNTCNDNAGMGIHYEISARATIASNVVFRNGDMGIEIANSGGNIYLYNNTLAGNRRAVHIKDDNRGTSSNPAIPYVVQFVECRNNLFSSDREEPFGAHDYRRIQTAEQMGVSADYDGYYRPSTSKVPNLAAWSRGSADQYFPRLVDFQNGTGQERHGLSIDNQAANPFFVDEPGGNFTLQAGSPAKGAGMALPPAIATAIGVSAGTPVDLGALRW